MMSLGHIAREVLISIAPAASNLARAPKWTMEIGGHFYHQWGEETSVDLGDLPDKWDVRVSEDGRVFFVE